MKSLYNNKRKYRFDETNGEYYDDEFDTFAIEEGLKIYDDDDNHLDIEEEDYNC